MKGNGKMGKLMVMEFLLTLTEKSTKGNGKMGKDGMDKGPITCLLVAYMKGSGRMV